MPRVPVQLLKKGMVVGNANRISFTVIEDAVLSPYRTAVVQIEHPDGRRERREWVHGTTAEVHVYAQEAGPDVAA